MNLSWTLQDAKNRFSEVVNRALEEGPQTITRRGKDTVVVMAVDSLMKMTRGKEDLAAFLRHSPLHGAKLDITRRRDYGREVDL